MKTWKFFLKCLWLLLLKVVSPSLPSRGGHDSFKQILLPLIVIESWEWTLPLATHGLTTANRSGSFCRSFFFVVVSRSASGLKKSHGLSDICIIHSPPPKRLPNGTSFSVSCQNGLFIWDNWINFVVKVNCMIGPSLSARWQWCGSGQQTGAVTIILFIKCFYLARWA